MKGDGRDLAAKYFFVVIVAILLFLSYKIIQPYIITLISAFILAYLVRPIHKRLSKKVSTRISALICLLIILLAVVIPLGTLVGGITNQALSIAHSNQIPAMVERLSNNHFFKNLHINFEKVVTSITLTIVSFLSSAVSYLPSLLIGSLILMLGVYYILIEWDFLLKELKRYIPFKNKEKIAKEISVSTKNIMYGAVLIAIFEFVVSLIGFFISGVQLFLFLPTLIFFLAFLPALGPAFVWVPMLVYYAIVGNWFTFFGVLVTGLILSIYVDTVFRSKALGDKTNVNPMIMLIGILGGINIFGVFGFIIGPLILIYTLKLSQEILKQ